jgi:phosphoesterase RecJ-like protein
VGIIHDTGVFRFSSTTPRTLEIAAKLMRFGFDFSRLLADTYYEKSYLQNQILGRAVLESIVFMDGRCIVSGLDRKTLDFYGVKAGDLEGIVNQLLITKGVECAIFMHQTKNMEYKVSLRSKYIVDVAQIATYFGGGGHVRAAGVTMKGTFHDIANNLSYHIEQQLKAK